MKKLLLLLTATLIINTASAQIPMIVQDPLVLGEVVGLASSAASQITTLANLLNLSQETVAKLGKITEAVTFVSNVKYILDLGISTVNLSSDIINFASNPKIVNPRSALNYTGRCIYGTESVIRNITRLTALVQSKFFEANDAERTALINDIRREIEFEEQALKQVKATIMLESRMMDLQKIMLQRQGIKFKE